MLSQLQGLHIEPTNMCTLKCPQCARTDFVSRFPKIWKNKNLDLSALKKFLDIDLSGKTINICGNYGDAIYYDKLFDMVDFFKQSKCTISIATNGSYKSAEWWNQLGDLLDHDDQIVFAIDGLPHNFTQYRINADWASIKVAIDILKNKAVQIVWQFIPFNYNEDQIEQAESLSVELGFDKFFVLPSERWDQDTENFKPANISEINHTRIKWQQDKNIDIDPLCKKSNNYHFISAEGYYSACCFVADHRFYYKSEFYKNKEIYNISNTTISQILQNNNTINFYNTLEDAKLNYCTFNCPKL